MTAARLFFVFALPLTLLGCPDGTTSDGGASSHDGGADDAGAVGDDAGGADADAGSSPEDAGADDAGTDDAGISSEAPCSFNDDCPAAERCECDEATGCFCFIGARGTGVLGVDTCETGDDCESALCLEGPGGAFYCSGECTDATDCGGTLPLCSDIAFVGRICVRDPADA